jgi:hypothetical protein
MLCELARGATPLVAVSIGGCWGESFRDEQIYHPKTGEKVLCVAHNGRGGPSPGEIQTMDAWLAWYTEKGVVKQ